MKKQLLSVLVIFITTALCKAQIFYGMTSGGGTNSNGTIISFNTNGNSENVVWNFGSGKDGQEPLGNLVYDANNGLFYGMTSFGGSDSLGAIISFNPATNKDSLAWSFTGAPSDGEYPYGSLFYDASNGLLYGMTYGGGSSNLGLNYGGGTIFSFNPSTNKDSVLWNFAGPPSDGAVPYGNLVYDSINKLFYGMTAFGGINDNINIAGGGAIISFNTATNKDSMVWSFGGRTDGTSPLGSLVYDASEESFYGTTAYGGSNDTANYGDGTIISFDPTNNSERVLWNFGSGTDGKQPNGDLVYDAGNGLFYTMTLTGGTNKVNNATLGTIVSFNANGNSESVVWDFGSGTDGKQPNADLVYDAGNGLFYGMTTKGGTNGTGAGDGTIISFDPTNNNSESVVWSFGSGTDGQQPYGDLVLYPPSAGAGINQLSVNNNQLSVYPNPTSGQFTIKSNNNQNGYTVEVYTMMGEKVYESVLSNLQNTINLGDQPAGIYFVYLKSGEGVEVGKVLVTK